MYFFDTFDTMITIIGYTEDQETFDRVTAQARTRFAELHRLFDAYQEYEGIQNIYTINRDAAKAPVSISPELIALLAFAKTWQPQMQGTVNIAMGSVLQIWHDYRTRATASPKEAKLPAMETLISASEHMAMESVVLDLEAGTIFFSDPLVQLDVGAIAKGYATEKVAQMMLMSDMPHFILNAGGNVRTGEPPMDGRKSWSVGIQDPDAMLTGGTNAEPAEVLYVSNRSVVTSGDYERFFTVDGARYHHIISPETLMPATENRAVTIVCEDSGLADILSTAIFILPYVKGRELIESLEGVEALWILQNSEIRMTEGMLGIAKSNGADAWK